jgi:CBS domain containing-hemolysin-like protein
MALLIFYVVLALGVSFLCSIMEAVLLSVSPSFVARMEQERGLLGQKLRALKDDVDRPLAAILSLNTIAHTVGAAGAGAQAAAVFGDVYVGVISAVLTFLILVVSEIIPKTLGALYWRQLAPLVVRLLVPTIWAMWPLVKLAQGLTRLLARGKKRVLVSREEFTALAELGAQEGVFHEDESRILRNLFRFGQIRAGDIMTPRTVLFTLPAAQTVGEALQAHPEMRFSRIPIYGTNRDDITGFVLKTDLLLQAAQQQPGTPLADLKRPLLVVPRDLPLRDLFEQLMNDRAHVALVVDEYGGTAGLVTLEDLVETLLGLEIVDEADAVHDMQEWARQQWRNRARRLGLLGEEDDETE